MVHIQHTRKGIAVALDRNTSLCDVTLQGKKYPITGETFAKIAERFVRQSINEKGQPFNGLTTSKIRGIYALIMNVYTRINTPEDFEKNKAELQYIKVKMAYEVGRDTSKSKPVLSFVQDTALMRAIYSIKTYDQFVLYCRYAESLVAYFKFYGGKEK